MFKDDIKKLAKENENFRKVLHTGENTQVVLMSLLPGEEIGEEVHPQTDQILVFVEGEGETVIDGVSEKFEEHDSVFVPASTKHNFINTGDEDLKLFTVYAPPQHPDGTVHKTKEEALRAEKKMELAQGSVDDPYENM